MEYILSKLYSVGPFFLLLGVLIFIHEWGHFIVARMCGVRVETFSIGFGPKLLKWKWGETDYCLSLIPLGGYVKMYGDGLDDNVPEDEKPASFTHQTLLEKIAIVSAGPLMNLVFAFFLFFLHGKVGVPNTLPIVGELKPLSPAHQTGLRYNDKIIEVNGTTVKSATELSKELNKLNATQPARLKILRGDDAKDILVPLVQEKNSNPLIENKNVNIIKGLSFLRTSNKIGFNHDSGHFDSGVETLEKITKVNDKAVTNYHEIKSEIENTKSSDDLVLTIKKNKGESLSLVVKNKSSAPWTFKSAGLRLPDVFIGQVQKGSPAFKAGIKSGDQVLKVNQTNITTWLDLLNTVKATKTNESLSFKISRKGALHDLKVTPRQTEFITPSGQVEYRPMVGIATALEYVPPQTVFAKINGFGATLSYAKEMTSQWTKLTLKGFKKLLTGEVSHKTLSGVISIGKVARDSLNIGWSYFIQMMAIISINLFLLNLLPVPVLDGGHLLFYFIEGIKGSPVSLKTKLIGQQLGLVVILSLVGYTIFNDLTRIVFSGW